MLLEGPGLGHEGNHIELWRRGWRQRLVFFFIIVLVYFPTIFYRHFCIEIFHTP
jgi:hypothetical protein